MSIDEAIAHAREVVVIQKNNDKLNKTLGKSSPYYNTDCIKCAEENEQLAEWLEELKAIKEMDLDIPQHFTKEQSDWIKAYCIRRNIEFYNKAIDDFADKLKQDVMTITFGLRICDIDRIAEQLKEKEDD